MSAAADALFVPDGDRFLSTELTRGPWSPEAQHGGPPAALLARAIDRMPDGADTMVARLTVELLRPVPVVPLTVTTRVLRPGRKVQLLEASLLAGEVEVARAIGLRIRTAALPLPALTEAALAPPPPDGGGTSQPPWAAAVSYRSFHRDGVEHRFVAGSFDQPGPATDWIRLRVPLVAGEPTPPLARVVAAADFGNGISWTLSRNEGYRFINPDLTLYLHRLPVDEWVCLDAVTWVQPHGVGLAESRLWDRQGPLGRSLQSLLLER
jgi:hypothetical protein